MSDGRGRVTQKHPVRVGQVWEDNDERSKGRLLRVEALVHGRGAVHWNPLPDSGPPTHARCVEGYANPQTTGGAFRIHSGRLRSAWIRLDRFRPTSTGYRLVQDAPDV